MTNPTCPRGHALGSVEGCVEPECIWMRGLQEQLKALMAGHDAVGCRRAGAEALRAAIEPLQARVRELEAKAKVHHDTAYTNACLLRDARKAITAKDARIAELEHNEKQQALVLQQQATKVAELRQALTAKDAELARVRACAQQLWDALAMKHFEAALDRPVVIEAIKLSDEGVDPDDATVEWLHANLPEGWEGTRDGGIDIPTRSGVVHAKAGDWLILNTQGEVFPFNPVSLAALNPEPTDE